VPSDPGHAELLAELVRQAGHGPSHPEAIDPGDSYTAGGHPFYRVSVPDRRRMVKAWLAGRKQLRATDVLATADSLILGPSFEEKTLGCMLLEYRSDVRSLVTPQMVEAWLEELAGWAEVDSLCQSTFPAEQLLDDWDSWRACILRLSQSDDINQRRASLVLLTSPVRHSADGRLVDLALIVLDKAKSERAVLISKAVSWLLRALVENHHDVVSHYLETNESTLPAIAKRETRVKLRTGTKRGRP
jgi:3-methyladenine DNA glycosylase AlkD